VGNTLLNGPVGSDSTAGIQTQVNALLTGRGGLIELGSNKYPITASGGVSITTQSISIVGASPGYMVDISGIGGGGEGTTGTELYPTAVAVTIGVSGSRIGGTLLRDLEIYGAGTQAADGIVTSYPTVDLNFQNIRAANLRYPINLSGGLADTFRIKDCSFFNNQNGIVATAGIQSAHIDNCEISNNQGAGIYIPYSAGNSLVSSTLSNSHFFWNSMATGYLGSGAQVVWGITQGEIVGNTFAKAAEGNIIADGLHVPGYYNTITGNVAYQNLTGAGIRIQGVANSAGPNTFWANEIDYAVDSTASATTLTIPAPNTLVCDLGSGTTINAPNGYTVACPPYPLGGSNPWAGANITATNGAADPSGYTSGILITTTTSNTNHGIQSTWGLPAIGVQYSYQVKVSGSFAYSYLSLLDGAGNYHLGYFNASTCTAGTVDSGYTAFTVVVGWSSGWCLVTAKYPNVVRQVFVGVANANGSNTFAGDGTSGLIIWQPQWQIIGPVQNSAVTQISGTGGSGADSSYCNEVVAVSGQKSASCLLVNYAQTGTAQTYTFPIAFFHVPTLTISDGGSCGTYNPITSNTALTLPANASMPAENCNVTVTGQ